MLGREPLSRLVRQLIRLDGVVYLNYIVAARELANDSVIHRAAGR